MDVKRLWAGSSIERSLALLPSILMINDHGQIWLSVIPQIVRPVVFEHAKEWESPASTRYRGEGGEGEG